MLAIPQRQKAYFAPVIWFQSCRRLAKGDQFGLKNTALFAPAGEDDSREKNSRWRHVS
jgi:hypothetical protein